MTILEVIIYFYFQPNVYEFGTTYEFIYQDLLTKDKSL